MSKERPILFQGAMVRALLAGTKTQTRRIVKPQPVVPDGATIRLYDEHAKHMTSQRRWQVEHPGEYDGHNPIGCRDDDGRQLNIGRMPFCVGDRLWVRETWMPDAPRNGEWADTAFFGCGMSPLSDIPECYRKPWHCLHRATYEGCELVGWKPSIHMPRWASRLTLEVAGVRVERLQDISASDAAAEGCEPVEIAQCCGSPCVGAEYMGQQEMICCGQPERDYDYVAGYRALWDSINGAGNWDTNPWVWVIEFRRTPHSMAAS